MSPLHALGAIAVMIIWGVNFVAAKIGLQHLPPLLLVGLRFALVALLLLPFVPRPHGKWQRLLILSVVMGSLHFGLMFSGLAHVDAAVASIAIQLQVPFAAILAAFFFKDYIGWRRMVGLALAFIGVVVLAGEPRGDTGILPLLLVILASLMWAIGNILVKRIGPMDGFTLNAWMAALTAPQLLFASWMFEPGGFASLTETPWPVWGSILYMAFFVTILAYGIWYFLVPRYDVNQTMPFTLLVPLFGVASGVLLLGEPLTLHMIIGGGATILGVAVIIVRRPRTIAPEARPDV